MNPIKEYVGKIRNLEQINSKLEKKLRDLELKQSQQQLVLRKERTRNRQLLKSRDNWRNKSQSKQLVIKGLRRKIKRGDKAKGHHYCQLIVTLSVLLRIIGGCSYGSIVKILQILNELLDWQMKKIPCENSVQNWVSKIGLFRLSQTKTELQGKQVSLIIDESIRLGQEKLLLILSVPFKKLKSAALCFSSVKVIYMKGQKSWTGEKISTLLEELKETYGFKLKNVLSDEDSKIVKACRLSSVPHLADFTHVVATCLRRSFENSHEFKSYTKLVSSYLAKGGNRPLSYLYPPKQRTKARFMNLGRVVKWSKGIIDRFQQLNEEESNFFQHLPKHTSIIKALSDCLQIAKLISLPFKTKGLSDKTLQNARKQITELKKRHGIYLNSFASHLQGYLDKYQQFLGLTNGSQVHACSEIIESIFGKYKKKANNYALTGLTNLNLEIPLWGLNQKQISQMVIQALEQNSISKLKQWKIEFSSENQLVKRNNFFNSDC